MTSDDALDPARVMKLARQANTSSEYRRKFHLTGSKTSITQNVCSGHISLKTAQDEISTDWVANYTHSPAGAPSWYRRHQDTGARVPTLSALPGVGLGSRGRPFPCRAAAFMRNSRSVANGVANDAFLTLFALVSKGLSV